MLRPGIAALLFLCCGCAGAGQIENVEVRYHEGRYAIDVVAILDVNADTVYAVITDYDHLTRLNDNFIESRLLSADQSGRKRTLIVTRSCVLFFCFKSRMVEDVSEVSPREIRSVIDASDSDYVYGTNHWMLEAITPGQTQLTFSCIKEPGFWVPPVIGPWIVKERLRRETLKTIHNIETVAGNA